MSESEDSEFATESGVTIKDVRHELGDGESQKLSENAIAYHLGKADSAIMPSVRQGVSSDRVQDAVALDAACRMVRSHKEAFVDRSEAADVSKQYDVESWIEDLRSDRDDAIGKVTGSNQPFLATLGGRSRSWSNTRHRR